jgi:hypothetical protein
MLSYLLRISVYFRARFSIVSCYTISAIALIAGVRPRRSGPAAARWRRRECLRSREFQTSEMAGGPSLLPAGAGDRV